MQPAQHHFMHVQQPMQTQSPKPPIPGITISQNRIAEALDVAKKEIDQVFKEITLMKYQKDDAEYKLSNQINEVTAFQQTLYELERTHLKIKQQYEEEISRLRKELELRGIQPPPRPQQPLVHAQQPLHNQKSFPENVPPPAITTRPPSGAFGVLANQQNLQAFQQEQNANGSDPSFASKRIRQDDNSPTGPPSQRQKLPPAISTPPIQGPPGSAPRMNPQQTDYRPIAPIQSQPASASQPAQNQPYFPPNQMQKPQQTPAAQQRPPIYPNTNQQQQPAPPSQPAMPQQQQPSADQSSAELVKPTGYIDFDAHKSSDESKITGEDYACYVNSSNETARMPPPIFVEPLQTLKIMSVVCCVKFSPDGRYLGVGCSKSTEIYEVESFRRVCALVDETTRKDYYVRSVVFSPDSRMIASGAEDHLVRICDIGSMSIKSRLVGHQLDIYSIDWSCDGKFIASASGDRTVKLWDSETGNCIMTLSCDDDPARSPTSDQSKDTGVTSVAIRPSDGRCVAAGTIDDVIRIWDTRTGQLLERLVGHTNSVYAVAFSPTGLSLVSGSLDKTLRVWDLSPETLQHLSAPASTAGAATDAQQSPQDQQQPSSAQSSGKEQPRSADASQKNFKLVNNTRPRHVFKGHKDFILSVAYAGKGSSLGMVDRSGVPLRGGANTSVSPTQTNSANVNVPDMEWVLCASKDRHVTMWDASQSGVNPASAPICLLSGHRNSVISIATSSKGGLVATGSGDMRTRIWRVSRNVKLPSIPSTTNAVSAVTNTNPAAHTNNDTPSVNQNAAGEASAAAANQPIKEETIADSNASATNGDAATKEETNAPQAADATSDSELPPLPTA